MDSEMVQWSGNRSKHGDKHMSVEEAIDDFELTEEDLDNIINIISKEGMYLRSEIVRVSCPTCGEEFLGTKRHAGGFIAGHRAFHEFCYERDLFIAQSGGE